MVLTGEFIEAREALSMGLVSQVVADDVTYEQALKTARRISKLPPLAVQSAKEAVIMAEDVSLNAGLTLERKALQLLFASQDKQEGMNAFIEKRKPDFKGE